MKAIDYLKSDKCPNIKYGMNLTEVELYVIAEIMQAYHEKQCAINGVVVPKGTLPKGLSKKAYKCANTMSYEGFLDWWELYS